MSRASLCDLLNQVSKCSSSNCLLLQGGVLSGLHHTYQVHLPKFLLPQVQTKAVRTPSSVEVVHRNKYRFHHQRRVAQSLRAKPRIITVVAPLT